MPLNYTLEIVKMANFITMYIITNLLISKKGKKRKREEGILMLLLYWYN